MKIEELALPEPARGEVRLRVQAIGLNRAEVMFRQGQYLVQPKLPSKLGYEAAGIVEAVGPDVDKAWIGKKVSTVPAFALDQYGVYGEVAIVPHSSPISASGILFYNTLFDENASCHIALGQCYSKCFIDGAKLNQDQIKAQGGNSSLIHIDWMIGSDKVDIDGIKPDGSKVPVMRRGEWA